MHPLPSWDAAGRLLRPAFLLFSERSPPKRRRRSATAQIADRTHRGRPWRAHCDRAARRTNETIKHGHHNGRDLTIASGFEAVGEFVANRIDKEEFLNIERKACPGAGSRGGMYTANTMSSVLEVIGLGLPHFSKVVQEDSENADSAAKSAEALMGAIQKADPSPGSHHAQAFMPSVLNQNLVCLRRVGELRFAHLGPRIEGTVALQPHIVLWARNSPNSNR